MSANAAANFTEAERAERVKFLRSLGLGPKSSANVTPIGSRRRPLGLAPAPGNDTDEHEASAARTVARSTQPDTPATCSDVRMVAETLSDIAETMEKISVHTKTRFDTMQASFENQVAALKNENQALRLILENLRVTQRGERGVDGDRGPPGRDGRDGVGRIGPAGPVGPKGSDAPRIVAWATEDAAFAATPILSDGGNGAVLHLRGMFEEFNEQINAADDDAERDAARAQRDAVEREVRAQGR